MNPELSPEALSRLNDKKWRRAQSKWMLWIYLTSSMLGVVGFARIAIRTKDKAAKQYTYILSGILFVLFLLIGLDTPTEKVVDGETISESGTLGTIGGLLIIANYGLQVYLSLKLNKIWLVYKAQENNPNWVQENLGVKGVAQMLVKSPQDLVKEALGINQNEYRENTQSKVSDIKKTPPPPPKKTPPPPPSSLKPSVAKRTSLDLNSASVEDLMKIAGIEPVLAANIVVQREKNNGFASFDTFASIMSLQPHQIAKLKPLLTVEPVSNPKTEKPGRVLDI